MSKKCMKIGEKRRQERMERWTRERQAAILARAESGISYTSGLPSTDARTESVSCEIDPSNQPMDLMDVNEDLTEEEARARHQLEIGGARHMFARQHVMS